MVKPDHIGLVLWIKPYIRIPDLYHAVVPELFQAGVSRSYVTLFYTNVIVYNILIDQVAISSNIAQNQ